MYDPDVCVLFAAFLLVFSIWIGLLMLRFGAKFGTVKDTWFVMALLGFANFMEWVTILQVCAIVGLSVSCVFSWTLFRKRILGF